MNAWTAIMVIAIVAITSVARVLRAKYYAPHGIFESRKGGQTFIGQPVDTGRNGEMQRELEQLRERVKVLERIATDDRHGRSIASEIESLRDK